jgi:UDPglucose 6-dehydrogenase
MNELSQIAQRLEANIDSVRLGIGYDSRIGHQFLFPGPGYGGSCFPKDLRALANNAHAVGYCPLILNAVEEVNAKQKMVLFEKVKHYFNGNIAGKCFAIWGLAFKPNTDDMREASSRVLMDALFDAQACVQAYDPVAMPETKRLYPQELKLQLCETAEAALENADALIIVTDWQVFKEAEISQIKSYLKAPVIFDARNLFDLQKMLNQGFYYESLGRPIVKGEK